MRICEQIVIFTDVLESRTSAVCDQMFTHAELSKIESLTAALQPLLQVTKMVHRGQSLSLLLVKPVISTLLKKHLELIEGEQMTMTNVK